ncbi:unannotated protein [freshwater metagenome]|uniref:Unannotated protein n=1 Tax=freshwater metagenome TaxID=449393 RepID=A0A6J6LV28_9ZZZZ
MVTMKLGELLWREVVMGLAINNAGKSGIGQHADGDEGVFAEIAKVLLHL